MKDTNKCSLCDNDWEIQITVEDVKNHFSSNGKQRRVRLCKKHMNIVVDIYAQDLIQSMINCFK